MKNLQKALKLKASADTVIQDSIDKLYQAKEELEKHLLYIEEQKEQLRLINAEKMKELQDIELDLQDKENDQDSTKQEIDNVLKKIEKFKNII